jgi:hypothetical protein
MDPDKPHPPNIDTNVDAARLEARATSTSPSTSSAI